MIGAILLGATVGIGLVWFIWTELTNFKLRNEAVKRDIENNTLLKENNLLLENLVEKANKKRR